MQKLDREQERKSSREYAPEAAEDHPALVWYKEQYPDKEILLACAEDIDVSGREDLLLIYRVEKGRAEAVAVMAVGEDRYEVTEPISAPVSIRKSVFLIWTKNQSWSSLSLERKMGRWGMRYTGSWMELL